MTRLLGAASPLAMIGGAIVLAVIIACAAEVASQSPEPGGAYLYVRRGFGRFAGLQAAWFYWLTVAGGAAAIANVFASYLGGVVPALAGGWARAVTTAVVIGVPTAINCVGVRSSTALSSVFAVANLLPLALLIVLGLRHSPPPTSLIHSSDVSAPGWDAWFTALLAVFFVYDGWEDVLVPSGEVKETRRSIPFALTVGLLLTAAVYALLQYVTVATIGTAATDHPLADVGEFLMGDAGRTFVSVGALVSSYGYIAAAVVTAPRLPYALATAGDAPPSLATLYPRFHTPVNAIIGFAVVSWVLAASGTFSWALELSAGSAAILTAGTCASLVRLRRVQPTANALRIPFGPVLAAAGTAVCAVLLAQLDARHALLMLLTASLATANWLWASRKRKQGAWNAA